MKFLSGLLSLASIVMLALPQGSRADTPLFSSADYRFRIDAWRMEPKGDKKEVTLVVKYENPGGGVYRLRVSDDKPRSSSGGWELGELRGEVTIAFLVDAKDTSRFIALHRGGMVVEGAPLEYVKIQFPLRKGPYRQ